MRNHRQTGTGTSPASERSAVQYHAHTRKSSPKKKKKLTKRVSVSHTLNLLRNGIILQKGHIIYTGNPKSQILTSKRKSRWNEWGDPNHRQADGKAPSKTIGTVLTRRTGCRARHERGELYSTTHSWKSQVLCTEITETRETAKIRATF